MQIANTPGPATIASDGSGHHEASVSRLPVPTVLTPLQSHVARAILAHARRENMKAGAHIAESLLAANLGTSRSPVNAALRHLARLGVVKHDLNRGFFLDKDAVTFVDLARRHSAQPDDPRYLGIASDRLARKLPEEVNEVDLMRTYQVTRSVLRKVLSRIQQEGWIEKSVGHGWRFLPMIDSPRAYEESYLYRAAIEPAGITSPEFKADAQELASLRRQQVDIVDGGFRSMTAIELFEANSLFHETLAKWSGNRFIAQAVRRTNRLRRLVEYRQAHRRDPRRTQSREHLAILDAITANDNPTAATLMREHLDGARRRKVSNGDAFGS
jgi:DNA-binding GntR family transcriptional regulator